MIKNAHTVVVISYWASCERLPPVKSTNIEIGMAAGFVFQRMGHNYLLRHIDCKVLLPDNSSFIWWADDLLYLCGVFRPITLITKIGKFFYIDKFKLQGVARQAFTEWHLASSLAVSYQSG